MCISNKYCYLECSVHQRILKEVYHDFHAAKIRFQFRMISEGSCDTGDWSNDAEHSALITEINDSLQYTDIENRYFTLQ